MCSKLTTLHHQGSPLCTTTTLQHHEGQVSNPRIKLHQSVLDVELIPPAGGAFLAIEGALGDGNFISVSEFYNLLEVVAMPLSDRDV